MSLTKKAHKKSPNGCKTCRRRRVKCDEVHPICTNCRIRELECTWNAPGLTPPKPRNATKDVAYQVELHTSAFASSSSLGLSPLGMQRSEPSSTPSFDMNSMQLLYHYSTSGNSILFETPPGSPHLTMRRIVTQIAFTHSYFMHAILAISALNIHLLPSDSESPSLSLRPQVDYYSLANHYFQETLNGLQYTELLEGRGPERDAAVFLTSMYSALFALARPRERNFECWAPKVLELISHARRWRGLIEFNSLRHGPIADILFKGVRDITGGTKPFQFPTALLDIHLPTSSAPDPEDVVDLVASNAYLDAVEKLKYAFAIDAQSNISHLGAVLLWAMSMNDVFYELLSKQQPRALVILAHYCVLMQRNTGRWWERDLDDNVRKISGILDLRWLDYMNESFSSFTEMDESLLLPMFR